MRWTLVGVAAGILVSLVLVGLVVTRLGERPASLPSPTPPAASPSSAVSSEIASPGPATAGGSRVPPTATPSQAGSPSGPGDPRIGQAAPSLAVDRIGGGRLDTAALRGRPIWVNFTASWCPTCRDELPFLERVRARFGDRLEVLVVDVREDEETVTALARELGLTLPIGLDRDGLAQAAWGAYALPVHYWLDAEGRIREIVYGGAGPEELLAGLRSVMPDASLEP